MKYLVDGANFVTSKMHFNPENNFYITLGLPESASQDEVRERWKRLMLLYHPDRQTGKEEWVSERAKKVNEAYSTLKDESKRAAYDRKITAQVRQQRPMHYQQPIHQPTSGHRSGPADQTMRTRPRRSRFDHKDSFGRWQELRKYLPKMLVGLYIVGAAAVLGLIYFQNNTSSLETELFSAGGHQPPPPPQQVQQPENIRNPEKKSAETPPSRSVTTKEEVVRQVVERPAAVPIAKPAEKRNELPVVRSTEKDALQNVTLPAKHRAKERLAYAPSQKEPQRQQPEAPRPKETAEGKRADTSPAIASPAPPPPVPAANVPKLKAADAGSVENLQKTVPAAPIVQVQREQKTANAEASPGEAKAQAHPATAAGQITRGEVEDFIIRYSAAYEKGDIGAFMIFFSPSAVENNMGYEGIRESYRKTFSEKIGHYRLQNVDIKVEGDSAFVSAKYHVDRFLSARDQWVGHSGRILWKLSKMNHTLKIVSAQYGD